MRDMRELRDPVPENRWLILGNNLETTKQFHERFGASGSDQSLVIQQLVIAQIMA